MRSKSKKYQCESKKYHVISVFLSETLNLIPVFLSATLKLCIWIRLVFLTRRVKLELVSF